MEKILWNKFVINMYEMLFFCYFCFYYKNFKLWNLLMFIYKNDNLLVLNKIYISNIVICSFDIFGKIVKNKIYMILFF